MKKENYKKILFLGLLAAVLFAAFTAALCFIDREAIGPNGSVVGFSRFNGFFHRLLGVNMLLYAVTDWLGLVPICFMAGFALLGLCQLIRRKSLLRVDADILILGIFYLAVIGAYFFFEKYAVNYRPVLIDGFLEASYPSSTTLLVLCVMPTAAMQLWKRIKPPVLRKAAAAFCIVFSAFMVAGRLLSGVHWVTDIIGGIILSFSLVAVYHSAAGLFTKKP